MLATKKDLKDVMEKWRLELKIVEDKANYQYLELCQKLKEIPQNSNNTETRLKELEIWQAKLHSLMIEKTPAGKEKLNRNYTFLRGKV